MRNVLATALIALSAAAIAVPASAEISSATARIIALHNANGDTQDQRIDRAPSQRSGTVISSRGVRSDRNSGLQTREEKWARLQENRGSSTSTSGGGFLNSVNLFGN